MSTLNKVMLIGCLGKDPVMAKSGKAVYFSIATNSRKDQETKTEWHSCVGFGKTIEIVSKYLKKGSKVLVEGSISSEKRLDGNVEKIQYNILVHSVVMLDPKQGNSNGNIANYRDQKEDRSYQQFDSNTFQDNEIPF